MLLLQQNEYLNNFIEVFRELKDCEELLDVTIACEDETIEVHKVVVAACSQFFRHVLSKTKQNHPFVYLKGVLYQDLAALIDYIYTGETKVPEDGLERFLEVARDLKVNGLFKESEETVVEEFKFPKQNTIDINNENEGEIQDFENWTYEEVKHSEVLNGNTSNESLDKSSIKKEYVNSKYPTTDDKAEQKDRLKNEISKRIERIVDADQGILWSCNVCGKTGNKKPRLELHIETHLEGFSHECKHCGKSFKTRGSLSFHLYTVHKGINQMK